jgi:hypothetical protein
LSGNGYLKLYRKITEWGWYKDNPTFKVFLHLLMKANYCQGEWLGQTVLPGQVITSSIKLADETGLTRQSVRTALNHLKSTNEITSESTNRFILVTIANWALYQSDQRESTSESTNNLTVNQPATNQQLTTIEEYKKERRKKTCISPNPPNVITDQLPLSWSSFSSELIDALNRFVEFRRSIKKPMSDHAIDLMANKLRGMANTDAERIEILNQSIMNGWQGIFQISENKSQAKATAYEDIMALAREGDGK